ncbi:hypothetical protein DI383_08745 [Flavobacteriaceae bacterium LYZ1037]|nr:hypothetical protein DI383_08745 [Flavobacteriaceae bacterium LYZ1037]
MLYMKNTNIILIILIIFNSSCIKSQDDDKNKQDLIEEEYYSGVNKRFEKSFINRNGLFFDDFEILPTHIGPKRHEGREKLTRYSYHSVVEKENRGPKNNSVQLIDDNKTNYISLKLSPKQLHKKINGYRSELTIHNGNPELEEEWYEWRFMIPEEYELDEENIGREVSIVQYHYVRPKGEERVLKGPTINFTYLEQYGKNMLLLRYGIKGQDHAKYKGFDWKVVALDDTIEKGKWYTLRVNIKWSLTNQGYIASWLNGKPFTVFNGVDNKVYGANLYNNIENTFKFGYYRYWDNSKPTSIYFDYIVKTRTFEDLTGESPSMEALYGVQQDYQYLNDKDKPLREIKERQQN